MRPTQPPRRRTTPRLHHHPTIAIAISMTGGIGSILAQTRGRTALQTGTRSSRTFSELAEDHSTARYSTLELQLISQQGQIVEPADVPLARTSDLVLRRGPHVVRLGGGAEPGVEPGVLEQHRMDPCARLRRSAMVPCRSAVPAPDRCLGVYRRNASSNATNRCRRLAGRTRGQSGLAAKVSEPFTRRYGGTRPPHRRSGLSPGCPARERHSSRRTR